MKETVKQISSEIYFAQHLAANDNRIRARALKKLRNWFKSRSSANVDFSEEDMLKIWKGLYYCMWMCDKPLNQELLAENISELIHCFRPKMSLMFIDTFFQCMSKEWFGIDRFRIEKFMLLVRRFLYQSFCLVGSHSWKPKAIQRLLNILTKHVINPKSDLTPAGLKMHVMDIYLEELAKAGGCELSLRKLVRFLKPYVKYLGICEDNIQLNAVIKEIFHTLIWQAFHDNEQDDEEEVVTFQVDYNTIADLLLKHTTKKGKLKAFNLQIMYKLIGQLRAAANKEFPFEAVDSDDDNKELNLTKSDINRAAKKLVEDDLKITEERKERLKEMRKKRKERNDESIESSDDEDAGDGMEVLENVQVTKPMKKRKKAKFSRKGKSSKGKGLKLAGDKQPGKFVKKSGSKQPGKKVKKSGSKQPGKFVKKSGSKQPGKMFVKKSNNKRKK